MSTLNQPGHFNCLAKIRDDEPFFMLRGQDRIAPELVRLWADLAEKNGCPAEKVAEARACAAAMEKWPNRKMPD